MMKFIRNKILVPILVGVFCGLAALLLKRSTEFAEEHLFYFLVNTWYGLLLLVMPMTGLFIIWIGNRYIYKTSPNKGLGEVLEVIDGTKDSIKSSKIFTHFFNGFSTVSTGGSTGIEVSSVISSSAIGNTAATWAGFDQQGKKYLLIAGAAAGIAGLFNSPLGGLFFAIEVLADTLSFDLIGVIACSLIGSLLISIQFDHTSLFTPVHHIWSWRALPFFIVFSAVAALISTYLTRLVVLCKSLFIKLMDGKKRVFVGGLLIGVGVFLFHSTYGEGYQTIQSLLTGNLVAINDGIFNGRLPPSLILLSLAAVLIIKPLITSVTLASGGDGGVFAPSLFLGAVAGLLYSHSLNQWIAADLIEVNFVIVGMAALLSASIQAPLTAVFLTTSITGNYDLFLPLLITAFLSKMIARKILPYTVYSYSRGVK